MTSLLPADIEAPPEAFYAAGEGPAREPEKKRKGLHPALKYGPLMAQLADAAATTYAVKNGAKEMNPVFEPFAGEPAKMALAKGAQGLTMGLLADLLAKRGHPNWAKFAAGLNIALPLGAAGVNLSVAERMKRSKP